MSPLHPTYMQSKYNNADDYVSICSCDNADYDTAFATATTTPTVYGVYGTTIIKVNKVYGYDSN